VKAVVLPGLVVVDLSRLKQASWPFPVGSKLVHQTWENNPDDILERDAILVVRKLADALVCTSGTSSYEYTYFESSFTPVSEWYYLGQVERKKKGFGKWFSEKIE